MLSGEAGQHLPFVENSCLHLSARPCQAGQWPSLNSAGKLAHMPGAVHVNQGTISGGPS